MVRRVAFEVVERLDEFIQIVFGIGQRHRRESARGLVYTFGGRLDVVKPTF